MADDLVSKARQAVAETEGLYAANNANQLIRDLADEVERLRGELAAAHLNAARGWRAVESLASGVGRAYPRMGRKGDA